MLQPNMGHFSRVDYFSKFIYEYFSFIAFLVTQMYPENPDGMAVIKLKENTPIKEKYLNLI